MPKMNPANELREVRISARGVDRLEGGHVWVYRSDLQLDTSQPEIAAGSLVRVADHRGKPLGTAFYSSASQIAIRMLSAGAVSLAELPGLLRQRIRDAVAYRKLVVRDTDAYRVIFSEADFLPGLIVDRYNDLLSFQVLTQAMDSEPLRQAILSDLAARLQPASIFERVDPRIRELEQLPPRDSSRLHGERATAIFTMNGV